MEGLEGRRLLAAPVVFAPVNASKTTDNENEVDIAVNPINPNQVFVVSNSASTGLRASYSTDGGATFTNRFTTGSAPDSILSTFCDARVAFDYLGNLYMVYLTSGTSTVLALARSTNGGQSFTNVTSFSGNWDNPSIDVGYNNQVWIQGTSPSNGQVAIGLQSTGLGTSGAPTGLLSMPTTAQGFGDIAVALDGSVLMTSHTSTSGQGPTTLPIWRDPDGMGPSPFALITNIATNVGGFDFIPAQSSRSIDAEPEFAVIPAGAPHAGRVLYTYTDELTNESNDTNVMLRMSDNNGVTWSAPIKLNDDATTRSQFLQSIAVDPTSGVIGAFWYDSRNDVGTATGGFSDTTANNEAQVYATFSIDGGDTFQPNVILQSAVSKASTAASPTDYGDWTGADFAGGNFFAAYTDNSTGLSPANASRPKLDIAVSKVNVTAVPVTGVAGTVWDDTNANGVFDAGEPGLSGATVYVDADNDGTLDPGETSFVTIAGGAYSFTGLTAGTYNIRALASGRRLTAPAGGVRTVTIATDQYLTGQTFGFTAAVVIGGVVFDDVNANGVRDAGEPAIPNARVFLDTNSNGIYDAGTQTFASANVPVAISATGTPTVTSTLSIPATIGTITKLTVNMSIAHTFDGDLVVTLISPDGTRVILTQQFGGSADNYTNTVFDDAAATSISSGTAPFTGTFRPFEALSSYIGKSAPGTWTLEVKDVANTDGGSLNAWSLTVQYAEASVLSAADGTYAFPPLTAGTYTVRQVLTPATYGFTNPVSGAATIVAAAGAVITQNFGSRDVDRPLVNDKQFLVDAAKPQVTLTFSENVIIPASGLTLTNLSAGNTVIDPSQYTVAVDAGTHVATVTFTGFADGILPDANWRIAVNGTVTDTGGKALANPGSIDFYTLGGDATRDRTVDFNDLVALAQSYNQSGKTFTQGNFNYDPAGMVDFNDLVILAQHYGTSLAALLAAMAGLTGAQPILAASTTATATGVTRGGKSARDILG